MSKAKNGRFIQFRIALAMALVVVALFSIASIQPAAADEVFTVNSTDDDPDADLTDGICETATAGECTLRAAIEQANEESDGVINLTIRVYMAGTYTLTDQLVITGQNIFIYGAGNEHDVVIDGNNTTRIFDIGGATVSIFWMTLQGGKNVNSEVVPGHWHGGAIHNHGNLTMSQVIIQDSVIASDTPGLATCTTHCGGAIYNAATATLDNMAFVNNANEFSDAAAHGGAISNAGALTVLNSTFSGNSTAGGQGSAVYNTGTADLTHVTVANNTTGASGAIASTAGTLTLTASILANNTGGNCAGAAIASDGYNLSDDATCGLAGLGDLDNNPNANLDPVLADNGGSTWTHALLPGSEAINHIPAVDCLVVADQRGVDRPQGAGCDIGAFELEFIQTYFQACLYAGSLSQVGFIGDSTTPTVSCGRGTPVVLLAGGDPGVDVFHACLYAGSLSRVGTTEPANCGRGTPISLVAGTDLWACLYAGSLSQVGTVPPVNCGRGMQIGLMSPP